MRQILACTGGLDIDPGLAADLAEHQTRLTFADTRRECAVQLRELQPAAVVLSVADDPRSAGRRCAEFRRDTGAALLALSRCYSVPQAVAVLDAGADDYMGLRENVPELAARIRALLRRAARAAEQRSFVVGDLYIDAENRTVRAGDRQAKLTPLEFRLLACLGANASMSLSPNTLLRAVQGYDLAPRRPRGSRSRSCGACAGRSRRTPPTRATSSTSAAPATSSTAAAPPIPAAQPSSATPRSEGKGSRRKGKGTEAEMEVRAAGSRAV